ncbi:MAG TPA: tetratricopeptide repeat protein [Polyangiaceae bacterium]|nr:tetratricopeptide repeat protein [Polyangiaceae bacterium]
MDQLSAHLDRGWDLAQRGDTRGAESSARRALEIQPDSPEAHNLLGFCAALEGDCEEAIEAYQQAIFLDETYVEAMLNAAELLVHPMAKYDEAVNMCDQVLDVSDYQDEIVDALLLKFEAMMAQGETEQAHKVLSSLPDGPYENGAHCYLAGRAHFELGKLDGAQRLIEAALQKEPRNADAHYYAALLCEERGDRHGACAEFLQTRQLELEMGMPPWAPDGESFLRFTEKAVGALEPELQSFLRRAEVYVADLPGPEVVVDGVDPRTLVLVDAASLGPNNSETVNPEHVSLRVFLYAINVMRSAGSLQGVEAAIADALRIELCGALDDLRRDLSK